MEVLCAFEGLKKIPFDELSCQFQMGGWAKSGLDVNYVFMDPPISFGTEDSARTTFQEYEFLTSKTKSWIIQSYYPCCPNEPWPILNYVLTLKRARSYYILKVIVPNILFTYLSFSPFWIDVRTGERLGYGVTILLAMVAVDIIASEMLPVCEEYLFIEAFVGGSVIFAFLALFETCLVVYWYYKDENEAEDNALGKAVAALATAINKGKEKDGMDEEDGTVEGDTSQKTLEVNGPEPIYIDEDRSSVYADAEEGEMDPGRVASSASASALRNRFKKMGGSFKRSFRREASHKEKEKARKTYMSERNLYDENLKIARRLDRYSRYIFIPTYTLFIILMFSLSSLW